LTLRSAARLDEVADFIIVVWLGIARPEKRCRATTSSFARARKGACPSLYSARVSRFGHHIEDRRPAPRAGVVQRRSCEEEPAGHGQWFTVVPASFVLDLGSAMNCA
jgi:hypothetical protein